MAKLRNLEPWVGRGVARPAGVDSRVVALNDHVGAGVNLQVFRFTPPVGGDFRLVNVSVWLFGGLGGFPITGYLQLRCGVGDNPTLADIAVGWDIVLECYGEYRSGIFWYGNAVSFSWDMNRRYTGRNRRFGLVLTNASAATQIYALCSFQIAEG